MMRLVVLMLLISGTAAAEPAAIDPEAARLQSAEAAVRAGRSNRPPMIINNRKAPVAAQTEARSLTMPQSAPREFPVPPRNDIQPTASGVQALVSATMARPAQAPKPATGDDAATAAGLDAIAEFRRSRGVAR